MITKIVFLSGTRADFGKLKSLIEITSRNPNFEVHIFATGMHMNSKFGRTVHEIFKYGYQNVYQFINHDEVNSMDKTLAKTIDGFSSYVAELKPDIIVIHGDRVEAMAGAMVGSLNNIRVIHVEGGELSGTIDDSIRHAVSKMSHVHMVANVTAKKRLLQLGESDDAIHIIGSPDLDLMHPSNLPQLDKVKDYYEIDFKSFALCMFHPVTTESMLMPHYADEFYSALLLSNKNYILVYPNNDLGSEYLIGKIEALRDHPNFRVYRSLRFEYFLRLLHSCEFIIGNSSAGIREAPYYGVPTIDVGTRQHNRGESESIVHVNYERSEIETAINRIPSFRSKLKSVACSEFGAGNSDRHFIEIISAEGFLQRPLQKHFQELDL